MLSALKNSTYRRLLAAHVFSLLGSGLATVALGLLAFDLAGADAGQVLGTALALKMVAYVVIGPLAGALVAKLPRRAVLVLLDVVRAALVLLLPFVTEIWQIYLLVFLFQALSAAFTPTFQATIPDILTEEKDYTAALSLSRLSYDLEAILSPLLAGLLLSIVSFHWLFAGNTLGFLISALLVLSCTLPAAPVRSEPESYRRRATRGLWIYLRTPRLRGLLCLNLAVAAATSMVLVNTVVLVRSEFGGSDADVAFFLAAYGFGSMAVAISLPSLLDRLSPRSVMLTGSAGLTLLLSIGSVLPGEAWFIAAWAGLGAMAALVQTPAGLLLRQSSHAEDRPAVFTAQFSLSHACWLIAYPLAGWIGAGAGLPAAFLLLAGLAALGTVAALALWPRHDPLEVEHTHDAIAHSHGARADGHHAEDTTDGPHRHEPLRHKHRFVIDDHHPVWPKT